MLLRIFALSIVLLAAGQAGAQIYRCDDGQGGVTFSQTRCADDAQSVEIRRQESGSLPTQTLPANPPSQREQQRPAPPAEHETYEERLARENAIRSATARGDVIEGMTARDVERALGRPDVVNTGNYPSGRREQWVYYNTRRGRGADTTYVYFSEGVVTSTQTREVAPRR